MYAEWCKSITTDTTDRMYKREREIMPEADSLEVPDLNILSQRKPPSSAASP